MRSCAVKPKHLDVSNKLKLKFKISYSIEE